MSGWVWVAILGLVACRAHDDVCSGEACASPSASAAGGAPVDSADGVSGAAGRDASAACSNDEVCQKGGVCDGVERCVDGRCEAGEAVECLYGTECTEAAAGSCSYAVPSPWLVLVASDKVSGLPVLQLAAGEPELVTLAERAVTAEITGFDKLYWAPSGKAALLHAEETQLGSSLKLLRFGAGVPERAVDVPDLPNWGDYWMAPEFLPDSEQVVIEDGFSFKYLVDLSEDPEPTQIFTGELPEPAPSYTHCADPSFWLQFDADNLGYVATDESGEVSTRLLGPGALEQSGDGQLLLRTVDPDPDLAEEGDGVWLESCSEQAWSVAFDDAVAGVFSPDSKRLLLRLEGGGLRVLSLDDPEHPQTVWASSLAALAPGASFTPDSQKLLLGLPESGGPVSLHALDLSRAGEPKISWLRLPQDAEVAALRDSSLLAWSSAVADTPRELLWQSLSAPDEPTKIYGDPTQSDSVIGAWPLAPDADKVLIRRADGEQTQLASLTLGDKPPDLLELAVLPGSIDEIISAPQSPGMVITTVASPTDRKAWWLALETDETAAAPRLLGEGVLTMSLQPWP